MTEKDKKISIVRKGDTLDIKRSRNLLSITDKVLRKKVIPRKVDIIAKEDEWMQRLWDWADEFKIPEEILPRDKEKLLAIRQLILSRAEKIYENQEWIDNPYKDLPKIINLPPEICKLSQLKKLSVAFNGINVLPPAIGQLKQLQKLYVGGNHLKKLPPEIGLLSNLQDFCLGDNKLSELPPEIKQLSNLQELHLWGNKLSILPPELEFLKANGCEIKL